MTSRSEKANRINPRVIIHGGAGNITRDNLNPEAYHAYRSALLSILDSTHRLLQQPDVSALVAATHAVSLLEDCALFNAGHGAVYTTAGTHELEASVMVSRGLRKRGVGVMKVSRVKNPILLAKEILLRGEQDDGGGAQGHCQLEGDTCDRLAVQWGLERVKPSYFWTRKRWNEHRRGLGLGHDDRTYQEHKEKADQGIEDDEVKSNALIGRMNIQRHTVDETAAITLSDPTWDGEEYLPQGTVGCVVLDCTGTLAVATSTGGLTNKLPGRIGDTPTLGAGFWAEEWTVMAAFSQSEAYRSQPLAGLGAFARDCLPGLSQYIRLPQRAPPAILRSRKGVAMSGTGNGDSFLRLCAVRTAAAITRFSRGAASLQEAVTQMAGPHGMLQQSAEDRWRKTGEGEGGIIGIEFDDSVGEGHIVADFNCGGLFRSWVDCHGQSHMRVFRDEY